MPPPNYILDIPSLQSKYPQLPASIIGLRLDKEIRAGTPLDSQDLTNAKAVAHALQTFFGI